MADFVTQHCGPEITVVEPAPWMLFFDDSSCGKGCGIGIVLTSPQGARFEFSLPIPRTSTNNQAEYEAVLKVNQLLREIKADAVEIFGDSMLMVNQLIGKYDCNDDILRIYHKECLELLREFKMVYIEHIPKMHNEEANRLAQSASGYRPICDITAMELLADDWRKEII
jgi:ribonuclease HI